MSLGSEEDTTWRRRWAAAWRRTGGLLALGMAWEATVRLLRLPVFYVPAPSSVIPEFWRMPALFLDAFLHTGFETVIGYLVGTAAGLVSGIVFAHARLLARMFFPYFIASQAVPVIAFSAVVVLWFGNGLASKVVIAFYLTFFPVTVNTVRGLEATDAQQLALLRTFGARTVALLLKLRLPTALPSIFVALRLAATTSLVGSIVGEWFGDTRGLGILLLHSIYTEDMPRLWASIILCATLGSILYAVVLAAERRVVWWRAEFN